MLECVICGTGTGGAPRLQVHHTPHRDPICRYCIEESEPCQACDGTGVAAAPSEGTGYICQAEGCDFGRVFPDPKRRADLNRELGRVLK